MQRVFTKDTGRYRKGEIRDYPLGTWRGIAQSVGKELDSFTIPVERLATTDRRIFNHPPGRKKG